MSRDGARGAGGKRAVPGSAHEVGARGLLFPPGRAEDGGPRGRDHARLRPHLRVEPSRLPRPRGCRRPSPAPRGERVGPGLPQRTKESPPPPSPRPPPPRCPRSRPAAGPALHRPASRRVWRRARRADAGLRAGGLARAAPGARGGNANREADPAAVAAWSRRSWGVGGGRRWGRARLHLEAPGAGAGGSDPDWGRGWSWGRARGCG